MILGALLLAGAQLDAGLAPPTDVPAEAPVLAAQPIAPLVGGSGPPPPAPVPTPGGDLVVIGRTRAGDPLVQANAESFAVAQSMDKAVVGPVADAYKEGLPKPIRRGLRNFVFNLREPIVAANYLLQLKPGKAVETLGRFAINTTIGGIGLFDVAKRKPFDLPRRRNSFANTLGYYGVPPGAFLYLPLIGATTVRDLIGLGIDQATSPVGLLLPVSGPEIGVPSGLVTALDQRVEFDTQMQAIRASQDPYATARKTYLETRQAEIDALKGRRKPASVVAAPVVPVTTTDTPGDR